MPINRQRLKIGQISNIPSFGKFVEDRPSMTDDQIAELEHAVLVQSAGRFDFDAMLSHFSASNTFETVTNASRFTYDVVAAKVYTTTFAKIESANPQRPGANGGVITLWAVNAIFGKNLLVSTNGIVSGMTILDEGRREGDYTVYTAKANSAAGMDPSSLSTTTDWSGVWGAVPREYSVEGSNFYWTGTATSTGDFHGIRYSSPMGGETEQTPVIVATITSSNKPSAPAKKLYIDAAKDALAAVHYKGKTAAILWDRDDLTPRNDPATGQPFMHAAGYLQQAGDMSTAYYSKVSLQAIIDNIYIRQNLTGSDNKEMAHYTAFCGSMAFRELTAQAGAMFPVSATATPGQGSLYVGFGFKGIILPDGTKLTFVQDTTFDEDPTQLKKTKKQIRAGAYGVIVVNVGESKGGRAAVINKKVNRAYDVFGELDGLRGTSRRDAVTTGFRQINSMKDAKYITSFSQFASVLTDPYGFLQFKLNIV